MAVARNQDIEQIDPRVLGELFARAVAGDPAAVRLWVSFDGHVARLWLQIEPVERERELHFYELADYVYERFPDGGFFVHLLRPDQFDELVPEEIVPVDSVEIALPAA